MEGRGGTTRVTRPADRLTGMNVVCVAFASGQCEDEQTRAMGSAAKHVVHHETGTRQARDSGCARTYARWSNMTNLGL